MDDLCQVDTTENIEIEINPLELAEFMQELKTLQKIRINLIKESTVTRKEIHDSIQPNVRIKQEPVFQQIEDVPMVPDLNEEYYNETGCMSVGKMFKE